MKKFIYMITIGIAMFVGINNVNAETLFKCNYKINFSGFGNAKDKNYDFQVIVGDSKKTTSISSFDNITGTDDVGGMYILKSSGLEKKIYESATSNNTCPDITFYLADSTSIQISVSNFVPDGAYAKTASGEFVAGKVQQGEIKNICKRTKKLRNEKYNVEFTFYTVDGEKYWKLSDTNGVKIDDVLAKGTHTFRLSSDIIEDLFKSNSSCKQAKTYLKCVNGAVENIEFTGKKPSDVENCSYNVNNATNDDGKDDDVEEGNTNRITTDGETLKIVQQVYDIVKILIPVLIIALSIIDFLKVILVSDDKNYKSAWDKFIKRLIIGVIFFLVPLIVSFILKYSGIETEQSYLEIFK